MARAAKRPGCRTAVFLVAVLLLALLAASFTAWRGITAPFLVGGDTKDVVEVEIRPGSTAAGIAATLHRRDVLADPFWFRALVSARGAAGDLKAGTYRFRGRMSAADVLEVVIAGPPPADLRVTIPEGLTVRETIGRLVGKGLGTEDGFEKALLESMPLVHRFDPQSDDGEGYLFPDTYRFAEQSSERHVLRTMIYRFLEAAARAMGTSPGGGDTGLDLRQIVTLASLVEKETALDDERGLVAGVFANRLRRGMLLQCDPTVIYAIERSGRPVKRLLRADLEFDSPWNTYRHAGLPPGPICCPGAASLRAASRPAETRYLFFVADGEGGHDFSRTIGEHNRAVARYRAWQRRNRP